MDFFSAALLLFFILDPVGNIPVFHAVLGEVPAASRTRIMARELVFAYFILLGFLLAGEPVLHYLGLKQPALSISGGLILFLIAIGMVFPRRGLGDEPEREAPFIVPLAVPMIAGPSAVAVLLLLASREPERLWAWVGALTLAWVISAAILLGSGYILRLMGPRGLRAMQKLIGMLLIMMAVQMFLDGLADYLGGL